ncbi:MAG: hypothetical protein VKP70_00010 [Cyanobacteriota bacterium]|nr:hypothetical protein [Cyanobacteriota bacterium]
MGLALLLQLLVLAPPAEALGWRLPGRGDAGPSRASADRPRGGQWREVSPPEWVQRARDVLEERDPQVRILAPAEGELLPDGPWTLRLDVTDWPLVDAGPLGLGPHLVVQLDGQPPRPIVNTTVELPPLSPGSHLLTVYAAKPWGEAHKSPLALQQRRLHRLAPNPATLPAPGTPQLIPVTPMGQAGGPPLLVDWLLVDAPLQGLRGEASGWRLRLTLNGESVLVDQQVPLWLQGWTSGSNALLLELLDGQGAPLNPPFNSLLREVIVSPPGASGPLRRSSPPATDLELAVLLGDQPLSALAPSTPEGSPTAEPAAPVPPNPSVPSAPIPPSAPQAQPGPPAPSPSEAPALAQVQEAPARSAPVVPAAPSASPVSGSQALGSGAPVPGPPAPVPATAQPPAAPLQPSNPQAPLSDPQAPEVPVPEPLASPPPAQTPDRGPSDFSTSASLSPSSQLLDLGRTAASPSPSASPSAPSASAGPSPTLVSPASGPAAPAPEPAATKPAASEPAPLATKHAGNAAPSATVGPAVGPAPPPAAPEHPPTPQPAPGLQSAGGAQPAPADQSTTSALSAPAPSPKAPAPSPEAAAPAVDAAPPAPPSNALTPFPQSRAPAAPPAPPSAPVTSSSAPVVSPSESLVSPLPARAELNPDGTLRRPSRPSPLERLRERLGR